jgi:hypothetical protein
MKKFLFPLIVLIAFTAASFAQLTESQVNMFFERFTDRTDHLEQLFATSFLKKVPARQLGYIRDDFENKYGKYVKVEIESGNNCKVYYEKAIFPCIIAFNPSGQVTTLWFGAPSFDNDKIEKIKQELNALQGVISICLRKDGRETYSMKKQLPLAVGSTFKLYILKALVQKIRDGELNWNDTVILDKVHKSLPSGMLQKWPENQTVTINTLANLMISVSDNTAADILIDKIGRDYIEKLVPSTMVPFYKTKEMFALKLVMDSDYVKWFINSDINTKRKELTKIDTMDISQANVYDFTTPRYLEIEWYTTTEDLCKTIELLQNVPALSINAGIVDEKDWYYVAFKGGSEPGVLNYTYLLQKKDTSPLYSLSATINDVQHVVDADHEFTFLIKRIIDVIEKNSTSD